MKIIGFDPGTRFCGFAVLQTSQRGIILQNAGLIRFKSSELIERIKELNIALDEIFSAHAAEPASAQIAVENIFYAHNPQSVLKLAQFRGALLLKCLQHFSQVHEYTALQVKKTLTGKAKADKTQVAFMVKKLLKIHGEIRPLDITDAMAIALTHAFCARLRA